MKVPFIDFELQNRNFLPKAKEVLEQVLTDENLIDGTPVEVFTAEISRLHDVEYGIGCANGTDALELALEACGVKASDEVIIPALSWISNLSSIERLGAIPIPVDVLKDYYTIDPEEIIKNITPQTKAVVAVHLHGLPADMIKIKRLCLEYNLSLIEDAAQSHLASIGNKKVGSFGKLATLSFYPTKNLGAYGDAGAILTDDADLAELLHTKSRVNFSGYDPEARARNSRLDTLQAALLHAKLPKLEEWTAKRRRIARLYNNAFADFNIVTPKVPNTFKHVFHHYVILVDKRDELRNYLEEHDIHTEVHYGKTLSEVRGGTTAPETCPVAQAVSRRCLSLPNYPEMTDTQIEFVIQKVRDFLLLND